MCTHIALLDVVVCGGFIKSIGIIIFGITTLSYLYITYFRTRHAREISYYLNSRWHMCVLRLFSTGLFKTALATLAIIFLAVVVNMIFKVIFMISDGGELGLITATNFMPESDIVYLCIFFGVVIQLFSGAKGLSFSIGNGLAISFNKSALAIHILESSPEIRIYAPRVIAAAAQLRELAPKKEIEIKSWFLVSKPQAKCLCALEIRRIFSKAVYISNCKPQKNKHLAIQKPRTFQCGVARFFFGYIPMAFYILFRAKSISKLSRQLLPAKQTKTADKLMKLLETQLGVKAIKIPPAPVRLPVFMQLAIKYPHIAPKFSGLDCGFILPAT